MFMIITSLAIDKYFKYYRLVGSRPLMYFFEKVV